MKTLATPDLHSIASRNEPRAVLAHWPAEVGGLPLTVFPIARNAEAGLIETPATRVLVAHEGHGRRWYRRSGKTWALHTAPQMIEIYEQGLHFDHHRWDGSLGRCVALDFEDAVVEQLTHGALRSLQLRTRHEVFDARISKLALELGNEAVANLPSGPLYAQGLCVALVGLLAHAYSKQIHEAPDAPGRKLSPLQQQRLHDLMQAKLGASLSLQDMANEAGLSPYHFLRVFKLTYGKTPHQYLQDLRLAKAAEALRDGRGGSIAEVALAHGFASQSHLTDVMRKRLGTTPRSLRTRR